MLLLLFIALVVSDILFLYTKKLKLEAQRDMSKMLSLGDRNSIRITIENKSNFKIFTTLYDELPYQFQIRDFKIHIELAPNESKPIVYSVCPRERGEYDFGVINAITTTQIRLIARRILLAKPQTIPVFPSIIQMKKYELLAFAKINNYEGIKKLRKIGHSYEFEKIKQYAQGDDIRSINWKATGRRNQVMVNQYEDERSQQVFCIIDKSRSMHMPFNGLSLLDYAVNTSLVISNIALKKHDKVGLITFSHLIGSTIPAKKNEIQLKKILNALYAEKPQPFEANFDLLYQAVKNVARSRSLVFIYTNFESVYAMERALPILKHINYLHLLVVVIFENTELIDYSKKKPEYVKDIYAQTIAQKLINDKRQIVSQLQMHGIQTIQTRPEDLSITTVNKYLELKARGLI